MSFVQLFPTHMLSLEFILRFCYRIAEGRDCKVEFIQSFFLALFRAKFTCNLAFRNLVFRWESCKGSVRESVKKSLRVCTQEESCD